MPKARPKKRPARASGAAGMWRYQWTVAKIILVACAIGAIAFFHDFLGNLVFETIGFAIIIWFGWALALIMVHWKRKWGSIFRTWNVWLGVLALTFASWGVLSLIQPSGFMLCDARFAEVSLGGNTGKYLVGNQGAGLIPELRLALLLSTVIGLLAPRPSLVFVRLATRYIGVALRASCLLTVRLLGGLKKGLLRLFEVHPPKRLATQAVSAVRGRLRRRRAGKLKGAAGRRAARSHTSSRQTELRGADSPTDSPNTALGATEKPLHKEVRAKEAPEMPPIDLLDKVADVQLNEADNLERARLLEDALASYGVEARVAKISPGPSVTQFGIEPGWDRKFKKIVARDEQGKVKVDKDGRPVERTEEVSRTRVKVERITALATNLALVLATPSIRIEAPVPGQSLVGIEVPNTTTSVVHLRSVVESAAFQKVRAKSGLALALGKGSAGEPFAADLSKMPHLLIAGETGAGKTVCLNSIITCLLMHNSPRDLRLMLIDPKRVELVSFAGVPHLISPVVVEENKAVEALRRVTREMDIRYNKFATVGVRSIDGYNQSKFATEPMPHLVVIIDELAHLMMSTAEVVEPLICRLAQLSRATGIHLIIATQRPSVDVVTGLIKANFPTRIAFAVTSIVDSRTILDAGGAEKLLGRGDMLYMPPDAAKPKRLRGCFASDAEIDRVASFWMQRPGTEHAEDSVAKAFASLPMEESKDEDPLMVTARRLAKDTTHISTSLLQRRLHIGYPRAARIMDALEQEGILGQSEPDISEEDLEPDDGEMER